MERNWKKINVEFNVIELPALRSLIEANTGKVDIDSTRIFNLDLSEYRNLIKIKEPIFTWNLIVYTTKNKVEPIKDWNYFQNKQSQVCYLRGYKAIEQKMREKNFYFTSVNSIEQCIELIKLKRIDYILSADSNPVVSAINAIEEKTGYTPTLIEVGVLERFDYHPYINKKHVLLIPKIEKAIKELKKSGFIDKAIESSYRIKIIKKPKVKES